MSDKNYYINENLKPFYIPISKVKDLIEQLENCLSVGLTLGDQINAYHRFHMWINKLINEAEGVKCE